MRSSSKKPICIERQCLGSQCTLCRTDGRGEQRGPITGSLPLAPVSGTRGIRNQNLCGGILLTISLQETAPKGSLPCLHLDAEGSLEIFGGTPRAGYEGGKEGRAHGVTEILLA